MQPIEREARLQKSETTAQLTDRADIVIVGGGLSGCAMATALADGRRRIIVLEARKGKNPRFNGELIHPSGVAILEKRGFLEHLQRAGGADVRGFACVPGVGRTATLLNYEEIPDSRPFGFAIDHHDLVGTMRTEMLKKPGIELRLGERVVDLLRDQERVVGVRTQSGTISAPLVIACDGRHSKIRALTELHERARLLSFTAAALLEQTTLPHPDYGHIFLGAWGPILVYPIRKGVAGQPVDCRTCIDLPSDMDRGTEAVIAQLRQHYLPHVPEGTRAPLERALDRGEIEMAANYSIQTDECVVPGLALVGDSAGCSHPITATGMTIALNDTQLLSTGLEGADLRARGQVDAALSRYQSDRYAFVRAREILADALYEVFRGNDDGARAVREGMFCYWNGSAGRRARSMALLSGAQSRLVAFMREYIHVVGISTSTVLQGKVNEPSLPGRMRSLMGLGRKSVEKLSLVARGMREGTLRLMVLLAIVGFTAGCPPLHPGDGENVTTPQTIFHVDEGASIPLPADTFGYLITTNTGGSYRIVWTDTQNSAAEFSGSITNDGGFSQVVAYGAASAQLTQSNQIDFDSVPGANLDGVDFLANSEPIYLYGEIDGRYSTATIYFADSSGTLVMTSSPGGFTTP